MEGPPVALLQERLRAKGVYSGNLDGIFGEQTEAAVKAFQARSGLETDGVVGPATWQALFR
jgi:peptidoglycan hydrolase-like protein with peptidoglycan-binding domain